MGRSTQPSAPSKYPRNPTLTFPLYHSSPSSLQMYLIHISTLLGGLASSTHCKASYQGASKTFQSPKPELEAAAGHLWVHISCCIHLCMFVTGWSPPKLGQQFGVPPFASETSRTCSYQSFFSLLFLLKSSNCPPKKKEIWCFIHLIFWCSEGLQTDVWTILLTQYKGFFVCQTLH